MLVADGDANESQPVRSTNSAAWSGSVYDSPPALPHKRFHYRHALIPLYRNTQRMEEINSLFG